MSRFDEKTSNVQVEVVRIQPGARYAHDLFDEFGNIILEAHAPIEASLIKHLVQSDIHFLYYDPTNLKNNQKQTNAAGLNAEKQVINNELTQKVIDHSKDVFNHIREIYKAPAGTQIGRDKIDNSRILVREIINQIDKNQDGIHDTISTFKNLDDYYYQHSSNVSILAALLGSRLEFKQEIRAAMGLGGLFHDIGMASIGKEIVNKVEKYTEEEFDLIKGHPHVGYKLVEKNPYMEDLEKRILLLHHEKGDGSGFPFGFDLDHCQTQIPKEVRLIALCDTYTSLVARKPPHQSFSPGQALRIMLNMVYAPFKKTYSFIPTDFRDFIRGLGFIINKGNFFIGRGDLVRLNTGEVALVEEMNKLYPLNPKITIVKNEQLQNVKRTIQRDMLKDYNSYIANVFDRSNDKTSNTVSIQKIAQDIL